MPSLIDMVLEYKPGRTNQVADALSRKAEPAAFKCEEVAATSWVTSTLPHRIRDGLEKDPREAQAKECKTRLGSRTGLLVTKGNRLFVPDVWRIDKVTPQGVPRHNYYYRGRSPRNASQALLERGYYWPRMMDDVEVCKDPPCMQAGQGRASEACWIARTFTSPR